MAPLSKPLPLIRMHGPLWARNSDNIKHLREQEKKHGPFTGVYVLCDGSMPVYIGRGRLLPRLIRHKRSTTRGQVWDHFSLFAVADPHCEADLEALLLRMLPFYLRSLNKRNSSPFPV